VQRRLLGGDLPFFALITLGAIFFADGVGADLR